MKSIGAVSIVFIAVLPLSGQSSSAGGFGSIVFPALGRAPAGVNPWGNVVTPARPQGAAAAGYNSGVGYGARPATGTGYGHRRAAGSGIYAYPVFIGGYGAGYGYADPGTAPVQPQDQPPAQAPATPPVVINQYFSTPPGDAAAPADASNFHYYQAPANDTAAPPSDSYYLIAFKDHSVYSAVAYYTEGDTLHYFTAGNVHNQASLSLVDRQLTDQLNRAHNIELRLP